MKPVSHAGPAPVRKLASLQVVRGFAAILVVLDHSIQNIGFHSGTPSILQNLGFQFGRFGVLVFFVISGFIMCYTSYNIDGPRITTRRFLDHRFRRIVPIYWIATLVTGILLIMKGHQWPSAWTVIGSALFLPLSTEFGDKMYPIVGQGWTLYYEVFFYLIFSMCLMLQGLRGLVACAVVMLGLCIVNLTWSFFDYDGMPGILRFYSHPIISLFVCGMAIGAYRLLAFQGPAFNNPLLIVIFLSLAAFSHFWIFVNQPQLPPASEALYYILASACVLVCVYAKEPPRTGWLRVGIFLGDASYSIYLVHNLVLGVVAKLVFAHLGKENTLAYMVAAMVAALLFGSLVHVLIERPITHSLATRRRSPMIETPQLSV